MLVEFCPALLIDAGTQPADLLDELRGFGFSMYEVDDGSRRVRGVDMPELLGRVRPEFGDAAEGYTNILCVKGRT